MKKLLHRYGLHILFILFIANIGLAYTIRLLTKSQTCFTAAEVASDGRCLYILNGQVFEKGTRFKPHKAHQCGSDVSAIIPQFHMDDMVKYLDPNYQGDICSVQPTPTIQPTNTPAPTATPVPTAEPTLVPTVIPTVEAAPTETSVPTAIPTQEIAPSPTRVPTTVSNPTEIPTPIPSSIPTSLPSQIPVPSATRSPGIGNPPTSAPTASPVRSVSVPSGTRTPTARPTVTKIVSIPASRAPACSPPPAVKGMSILCPICR